MQPKSLLSLIFLAFSTITFAQQLQQNAAGGQTPKLVVPKGHTGFVSGVFSPGGKELLTYGADLRPTIWEVASARVSGYLTYEKQILNAFFLGDRKTLITISAEGTISYWNWRQRKITYSVSFPGKIYRALENETASTVSLIYTSGNIVNWAIGSRKKISSIAPDPKTKYTGKVALSGDGAFLATSSYPSGKVMIWKVAGGKLFKSIPIEGEVAEDIYFLPKAGFCIVDGDGAHLYNSTFKKIRAIDVFGESWLQNYKNEVLVSGVDWRNVKSPSGELTVTDMHSGELLTTLKHIKKVIDFRFLDSSKLISVTEEGYIYFWNFRTGENADIIEHNSVGMLKSISLSADKKMAAILSTDIFENFTLCIIDTRTNQLLSSFERSANSIKGAYPSPDGMRILFSGSTAVKDWEISHRDLRNIGSSEELLGYTEGGIVNNYYQAVRWHSTLPALGPLFLNWDKHWMLTSSQYDYEVKLWDLRDLKNKRAYNYEKEITAYRPDASGILLFLAFDDSTFCVTSLDSTASNVDFYSVEKEITGAKFFPDALSVMLVTEDTLIDYDLVNHRVRASYFVSQDSDEYFILSNSCKWLLRDNGQVIDLSSRQLICTVPDLAGDNWKRFDEQDSIIIYQSTKGTLNIYNVDQKRVTRIIKGVRDKVLFLPYIPAARRTVIPFDDRTTRIWDLEKQKEIASFVFFGEKDYIIQLPSGYYMCTPGAARLLHYVSGNRIIGLEQLDTKFNRPDKVLEALGNADSALIRSYRQAWEKRMQRLGVDTTSFNIGNSVPVTDFVNRDEIGFNQGDSLLRLHISGTDNVYSLDRLNVWINEVPVYGQRGINLKKRDRRSIDTTVTVKLSDGKNRIETSITNINGTESYRKPLTVHYYPLAKPQEKLYFIGIGIDRFADSQYNLQFSSKDIRDLSTMFLQKFDTDLIIDTLFNDNVTLENVKALKEKLRHTGVNDKVIIAYSGHGMLSKEYDYYLSTYNVNFNKPEENGLPYEELESLLDSIPARKKLLLIDACHSGEVDKEDLITLNASSDSLIKGFKPVAYKNEGHLGLKNSFELMQSLFVNVGKSTGATIISAAAGTQFALERNDLKNGVFTYAILEAMHKYSTLKISELKKIVGQRVEELTKGLQKPTSRNETIAVDWDIW